MSNDFILLHDDEYLAVIDKVSAESQSPINLFYKELSMVRATECFSL